MTFPLCRTCVEQQQVKPMLDRQWTCTHTDQERLIRGTWCTPEISKAVQKGYRIVKIYEIWHFPEDQRVEGLFTGYVDTWLKMKQESSGRPSHVRTPEELQNYINHHEAHEGIRMKLGKIVKSAVKRLFAKLMLNSFWAKFEERLNKPAVESITAPHELFEYLNNSLMVVHAICIFSEDVLEVAFSYADEDASKGKKTNILIAAFTTAQARLKLYSYLDPLRDQVLYYDTDSVIYSCKPGQTTIAVGDYLSDLTSELNADDYITEFVSGGAKNYGYLTKQGKSCCNVRGFTLNYRGSRYPNYEVMKQNVLEEFTDPLDKERFNRFKEFSIRFTILKRSFGQRI